MDAMTTPWDYLIVTASNDAQARAYVSQLGIRRKLGLLADFGQVMVVPDPQGKRIGSGGSTLLCLMQLLERELGGKQADWAGVEAILRKKRVLIIHAGGDSRRVPAYGPCGKIFVPIPGENSTGVGTALFDSLLPRFIPFPAGPRDAGQVVVAAGDALLQFDPSAVQLNHEGLTALGCHATPEHSSKHGVFCPDASGRVRFFLQKPSPAAQAKAGAINREGFSILDIAVMSFDAAVAVKLLQTFNTRISTRGKVTWADAVNKLMLSRGLDLYREVCCAMGSEATLEHYLASTRDSGSAWDVSLLKKAHKALSAVPFHVQVLPCSFLHFGTTKQLISSGLELLQQLGMPARGDVPLSVNNELRAGGSMAGPSSWVEGCRLSAPLKLAGQNVVVGVDVDEPLSLPSGACLDVLMGRNRKGKKVWFVRCYGLKDAFKDFMGAGAEFCGKPLADWLAAAGVKPQDVWDQSIPETKRSLWDARVFPAVKSPGAYRDWLWMFDPALAAEAQKKAFLGADRYSVAEVALLADQEDFYHRRSAVRSVEISNTVRGLFRPEGTFSAEDLAHALRASGNRAALTGSLLSEAWFHLDGSASGSGLEVFRFCRIIHSLGSALADMDHHKAARLGDALPNLAAALPIPVRSWMNRLNLAPNPGVLLHDWASRAKEAAFRHMNETILRSSMSKVGHPKNSLRPDESVWGRAPARLELGGGWTDTPPYTLEHGGSVANTAINLNGQPPIHCFARVTKEPTIRLNSIDGGQHLVVSELEELIDYRRPGDSFALVKAALAIAGFSPDFADWPARATLKDMLREFGGGIELTTLVGIPKGSGLGTSSILGATIVATVNRLLGRPTDTRELFHNVLRLEQALTTGGGWQDQIGGGVGGTKITITRPGMFPDPDVHYVPSDVLDPELNGQSTLIYYVGLTRLAKNILQQVVGGYFNRNRTIMSALAQEHKVARHVAQAMSRKDAAEFGHYINEAWRLQKQLCGEVTNETIEALLNRVGPHIHGARISGAGSGGFLIMICKSPRDARWIREDLTARPLNDRSRFFEYQINHKGLEVTTC